MQSTTYWFIKLLPRRDTITSAFILLAKVSQWPFLSPARPEGTILLQGTEAWERKLEYSVDRNTVDYSDYKRREADISHRCCQQRIMTAPLPTEDGLDLRISLTPTFLKTD